MSKLHGITISLAELIKLQRHSDAIDFSNQHRVLTQQAGAHLSKLRGRGIDFEEIRNYQHGDDVRLIDWRVAARTGELRTKVFREERDRPVFFMVDQSASMSFGTQTCFKSVVAARAAALLAWAAAHHGEKVGGLVFSGDKQIELPPRARQSGVLNLLKVLSQNNPLQSNEKETDGFEKALLKIRHVARPGSLIIILSDFSSLEPSASRQISALAKHSDLISIMVNDPIEKTAPPPNRYPLSDGENMLSMDTSDKTFRMKYEARYEEKLATLESLSRSSQIPLMHLSTSDDVRASLIQQFGRH